METTEKECSALGGLFQLIISDLKGGSPVWDDFLAKATKLHSHLKATVLALAAFLDSFQKIADLATNTRGATKDIGTALTRLCLRHRSVEAKLKTFSSTIMDHLVIPLQERLEDWRKLAYQMDKDHAKEYKHIRQDIKKKSSDTLRLQKKVRKAGKGDIQKTLDTALQDVSDRYHLLEETEKQAVRRALIEERGRYCLFVGCLRPVVESELATLHEITHLQEVLDALTKLTEDPHSLPSASEQVITDIKGSDSVWSFQTPPSSPTSLGSRKSSMCSISSMNSSSSDSTKSHSPSHHRCRSLSQQPSLGALRLSSVSSQDSGFTSQDTLFTRLPTPPPLEITNQVSEFSGANACTTSSSGTPSSPFPPAPCVTATWPNLQDTLQFERAAASIIKSQRPHTISSAYERLGHNRPALTAQTFQPLGQDVQQANGAASDSADTLTSTSDESSSHDLSPENTAIENVQSSQESTEDNSTPVHKPNIPPLPERYKENNQAHPVVPEKPHILKLRCSSQKYQTDFQGAACDWQNSFQTSSLRSNLSSNYGSHATAGITRRKFDLDITPEYVNLKDLIRAPPFETNVCPPELHSSEDKHKVAFHKDLAALLAQNLAQQHKQIKAPLNYDRQLSDPTDSLMITTSQTESTTITKAVIEGASSSQSEHKGSQSNQQTSQISCKPPPPPVRRSSSLSIQPPIVPPHKLQMHPIAAPMENSFKASVKESTSNQDRSSDGKETSWNVFNEANDSSTAHAQLIQALNARLNVLQQQSDITDHGRSVPSKTVAPQPMEQTRPSSAVIAVRPEQVQECFERMSRTDSNIPRSQQASAQPIRKPSRAHSIGGSEREAFIKNLNSKFAQNQTQNFVQQPVKRSEASTTRYNKYATNPRNSQQASHRRASQPIFPDMIQSDKPSPLQVENTSKHSFIDSLNVRMPAQQQQQQLRQTRIDRRSSLNLEQEFGSHSSYFGHATLPSRPYQMESRLQREQMMSFETGCPMTDAAARVQSWLASRGSVDITQCRESLLGQIRQGIPLRKATSNDRSAPTL